MEILSKSCLLAGIAILLAPWMPVQASVAIESVNPSPASPQTIGQTITWTITATDSNTGPLTFQFNVQSPGGQNDMVKDFNVGTLSSGTWTSQPFVWTPTGIEGAYQINVVAKDFTSGESASSTVTFSVNPLVTGSTPVVVQTANPLVALFSAPSCPQASHMRVSFQASTSTKSTATSWMPCHPRASMTFEVAGMYPRTTYTMFAQTETGGSVVNGPTVSFTTGALPGAISFPSFTTTVPPGADTDTNDRVILNDYSDSTGVHYPKVATDLSGRILWYYNPPAPNTDLMTWPLPNGTFLLDAFGQAWNPRTTFDQLLHQVDLAGNLIKETNIGVIAQQLLAMGATDAQSCNAVPQPVQVGTACLGIFHHDIIQTLPNGYSAAFANIEKIFPPGTQGDTSGLPVDIIGDMIIVLDQNWQVVWYFDAFEHDGGGTQLDINRPAVLGETCSANGNGCAPMFLLGPGIAPLAHDWLHSNSLYYWPAPQNGGTQGDIIWSSRHQDWVMRIDYKDGTGTGDILWRMGLDGDFTFNNINNDPWPWFSHQHEVEIALNGDGPMTLFDNGNTRITDLGSSCGPSDCDSRGTALTFNETTMQVTPVMSVDMGVYSHALGSAQILDNNNYFFETGYVPVTATTDVSQLIEILPTAGTTTGTQVLNFQSPGSYRAWRMTSMYTPPGP
ncbi:MAG TPA: aryl-sulfate sulfotransferase [Bryobacteraceae bacterium]|nr:aryl-sulfate sulfotransferase [Bryobacteraceae bacterium]